MQIKPLRRRWSSAVVVAAVAVVSGCGGAGQASIPPSAVPSPTQAATSSSGAVASPTPVRSGDATLDAPSTVEAGAEFEVAWTGPANLRDYVTIVTVGSVKWTDEFYFNTTSASPGTLVAPIEAGDYELWYVNGVDDTVMARRPIAVTSLTATLDAPAQVQAGTQFQVAWTGPDGPGDYVTIVAVGTARWTNEFYFDTSSGNPGSLVAPVEAGAYEVWYVTGQDPTPQARRSLTVTPFTITLQAPASVKAGADFQVTWTGPNGPSDYVTIVPAGSPDGTYLDYEYTAGGSALTLTAPDQPGAYEIWYASDRVDGTFGRRPIVVE